MSSSIGSELTNEEEEEELSKISQHALFLFFRTGTIFHSRVFKKKFLSSVLFYFKKSLSGIVYWFFGFTSGISFLLSSFFFLSPGWFSGFGIRGFFSLERPAWEGKGAGRVGVLQ